MSIGLTLELCGRMDERKGDGYTLHALTGLNMRADRDVCYDYEYRYVDDLIGASKLVFYVHVV